MGEPTAKKAKREFVVSEYFMDRDGRQRCEKPESLPCGCDGEACRVWVHEWRPRVSGPEFALMVVRCQTHDRHFTVYPSRHVPYGRVAIGPSAEAVADGLKAWLGTLFEATVSESWQRDYAYTGNDCWQTHRRRLLRCGALVGLRGDVILGESIAALLDVPLHVHATARQQFQRGDIRSQRSALGSVLATLESSPRLWRILTRAGRVAGLWGDMWEWSRGGPLLSPFPVPEVDHRRASAEAPKETRD
jgi:hypothetical protein